MRHTFYSISILLIMLLSTTVFSQTTLINPNQILVGKKEVLEMYGKRYNAIIRKSFNAHVETENLYWINQKDYRLLQGKATFSNGMIFWFKRKK